MKRFRDLNFIFSLGFILFIAVYLVIQEWNKQKLDEYLQTIQSNITSMLDNDDDKQQIRDLFTEIRKRIGKDQVSDEQIREMGEKLVKIRKEHKKLTLHQAVALVQTPPKKVDEMDLFMRSLSFLPSGKTDWQRCTFKLKRALERSDSLRAVATVKAQETINRLSQKIDVEIHNSHAIKEQVGQMQKHISELNDKLQKDLPGKNLKEIENELIKALDAAKARDVALQQKLSVIQKLQEQIDREREKLSAQLARIDSVKEMNF